jgi:inorganic pyrophosphatase
MADDKGQDEKVICVPVSDPIWNSLNDLSDMNPHLLKEIEHFFQVYKDLENKTVDVGGWGDVNEAYEIIKIVQNVLIKLKISLLDYSVYKYV